MILLAAFLYQENGRRWCAFDSEDTFAYRGMKIKPEPERNQNKNEERRSKIAVERAQEPEKSGLFFFWVLSAKNNANLRSWYFV